MATNATELQKYFADMDATEETNAKIAGVTPDEYRLGKRQKEREQEYLDAYGMPMETQPFVQVPPSMRSPEMKEDNKEPFAYMAPVAERLMAARKQGTPASGADFASLQKLMSPGALKAPEAQPIPTASAGVTSDAAAPVTSTLPATTGKQPAGPPDSMGRGGMVAPSSEGAGGDTSERDLYLARLAAQSAAGFGGMGAGKNIDMGIADTLGERLKQVQALRARREEQGLEQARERSTWGSSNRATLASALAQWKGDPEKTAALEALASGADATKPGDFSRNVVNAVMTKPKVLGAEAGVVKAEAGTTRTLGQAATDEALRPGKIAKLEADTELSRARKAKIYKDMELAGTKLALDERKTIEQAQQSKDPFKKLESLNTIADKKEFGGFTTLAGDLSTLERIAPGFVTEGKVPEWLTREQQLLGQQWPTSTNPKVVEFLAAYGKVANEERHRQYGSAQTDGELRSFMQQLNANPLSAGPKVLARQVKLFADAAGRVAKGRLTRYNNVFGAENVDTVFAPEWKPLFDTGGVFSAQGSPFATGGSTATPKRKPQPANTTAMLDEKGKPQYVPNDQVSAAEAAGWKRE